MVLSSLEEYSLFPFTVRHCTLSVCSCKVAIYRCVSASHTRVVVSKLPEYSLSPSTVRQSKHSVCPCKVVMCIPDGGPRSSWNCCFKKSARNSTPYFLHLRTKHIINMYLISVNSLNSSLNSTAPPRPLIIVSFSSYNVSSLFRSLFFLLPLIIFLLSFLNNVNEWLNEW